MNVHQKKCSLPRRHFPMSMKSSLCAWSPPHVQNILPVCRQSSLQAWSPPWVHEVLPSPILSSPFVSHILIWIWLNLADKTIPLTQASKITFVFNLRSSKNCTKLYFLFQVFQEIYSYSLSHIEIYYQQAYWDFWALSSLYRMRRGVQKHKRIKQWLNRLSEWSKKQKQKQEILRSAQFMDTT